MSIERRDKPKQADEVTTARAFLDYQRATFRLKVDGLSDDQLGQTLPPSDMTLGGMLAHLAYVEEWWTSEIFGGVELAGPWAGVDWKADIDYDWHYARGRGAAELVALLETAVARSDEVIAAASFDDSSVRRSRSGEPFSMRWIVWHLVEEYARHCGHADLIRQSIDGAVGD